MTETHFMDADSMGKLPAKHPESDDMVTGGKRKEKRPEASPKATARF